MNLGFPGARSAAHRNCPPIPGPCVPIATQAEAAQDQARREPSPVTSAERSHFHVRGCGVIFLPAHGGPEGGAHASRGEHGRIKGHSRRHARRGGGRLGADGTRPRDSRLGRTLDARAHRGRRRYTPLLHARHPRHRPSGGRAAPGGNPLPRHHAVRRRGARQGQGRARRRLCAHARRGGRLPRRDRRSGGRRPHTAHSRIWFATTWTAFSGSRSPGM